MRREVTVGGGHASGQAGWLHFGVGDATETDVRVVWPDGVQGEWQALAADQFYVLERDQAVKVWTPQ
jgi:enediyne biosynthesis protein E4